MLDIVALAFVAVGLWNGWVHGSVQQLGRVGIIVAAALLVRVSVAPIAAFYQRMARSNVETAVATCFLVGFVVVFVIFWILLARLTLDLRDAADRTPSDRFFGAVLGAAKGGLFVYIITVGLFWLFIGSGAPALKYDSSRLGRYAMERDFLDPVIERVYLLAERERGPRLRGYERRGAGDE